MIHELRTYVVADGRMPELLSCFEDVLFAIFDRAEIKIVSFWTKQEVNELVYVCEFANEAAKQAAWDSFKADPAWLALIAQTDPKGPMETKSTSEMLTPIPIASVR